MNPKENSSSIVYVEYTLFSDGTESSNQIHRFMAETGLGFGVIRRPWVSQILPTPYPFILSRGKEVLLEGEILTRFADYNRASSWKELHPGKITTIEIVAVNQGSSTNLILQTA